MKTSLRHSAIAVLGATAFALAGCYYMPGVSGNSAKAGLVINKAVAPNIASIAVVVEGPGMNTISKSFPASQKEISIDIPSGNARKLTLLINSPSATLAGTATVDLSPGEDREIMVEPKLASTQIVIPDLINHRIVQISDMSGTGWIAKTAADFGGGTFNPYDIDFDDQGRIYIANNYAGGTVGTPGGVIRIDDIEHTGSLVNIDSLAASNYINALTVDRVNGYVYYTHSQLQRLYQRSVSNYTSYQYFDLTAESAIVAAPTSVAVDENGMIYLLLPNATASYGRVVKYDINKPYGSKVIANSWPAYQSFSAYNDDIPWGVMLKGDYIYVSDGNGGKIVRFDRNLNYVDTFNLPSVPATRPLTFLARLNRKFTLIDEGSSGTVDRLVQFTDMSGSGWTTFGSYGTGTNQFQFYGYC